MLFNAGVLGRASCAAHITFLVGIFAVLSPSPTAGASSVSLGWGGSASPNIAGYRIHYGTASGAYSTTVDAGSSTNLTVSGLVDGVIYYFAATAYDTANLESDYSSEVGYTNTVQAPPTITLTSPANNATFTAPATLNLAATVTANGHAITKVQFFNGSTLLGEATSLPYAFNWSSVAAASYSFTSRLVYDGGATLDSTPAVQVLVAAPRNSPPTISAIANLTMNSNTVIAPIAFTVGDAETAASNLTLWASSDNLGLVPSNIVLGGSESNRTVMITPVLGQTGIANIAITVSDGSATASTTFQVTVRSTAPTVVIRQHGRGRVSPDLTGKPLLSGKSYSVTAVPDMGQAFVGWTGGITSATPKVSFVMKSNLVLEAGFSPVTLTTSGVGTVSPDLRLSQGLLAGRAYTITAVPGPGQLFAGWSGSTTSSTPSLHFVLSTNTALQANFIPNPYLAVQGTYNGLLYEADAVRSNTAGAFSVSVTARGSYSGSLRRATSRLAFGGLLDLQCQATNVLRLNATNALCLQLGVGGANQPDQISGRLTDGTWVSTLSGYRAVFNTQTNPAPYAGAYTLRLPGQDGDAALPGGDGFGTVQVSSNGLAVFAGKLADGTAFSQSAQLSREGLCPLYVPLYSGHGLLLSWLAFTNQPNDDFHGLLSWLKPADLAGRVYPGGFAYQCLATGSAYRRPVASTNQVLNFTNAYLGFSGGNLVADFTNSVVLGLNNQLANLSSNPLTWSFSLATGTFKGSAIDPATGKALPFSGAVFQKENAAYGFLLGTNQSSRVSLAP